MIGSILSFAGLVYIIGQGNLAGLVQSGGHLGDVLMVVAVFFYAFYGVFLKKWQLQIPLMLSLYVQIFFALLYHYLSLSISVSIQSIVKMRQVSCMPAFSLP